MNNHDLALRGAIDRDLDDSERLDHLESLVSSWIDQLIPELPDLRHPRVRWQPADLMDTLRGELTNICGERFRVTHGPVVLEDAA